MAFTNKNLQSHKSGMTFLKGATFFFLGMSVVMFMTQAFEVIPSMKNTRQYIQDIIFTTDGYSSSATTVTIDGSGGNAYFAGTVTGAAFCLEEDDCIVERPEGGVSGGFTGTDGKRCIYSGASEQVECFQNAPSGIGGDSVWMTGATGVAYYNDGNVGIGTDEPEYNLEVVGGSGESVGIATKILGGLNSSALFLNANPLVSDGMLVGHQTFGTSVNMAYVYNLGGGLYLQNGITIDPVVSGSNVGIGGNPSSTYKLKVTGTGEFTQGVCLGSDCRDVWPEGGGESVWLTGSSGQAYYSNGYVGIGTTSPTEKFQVNTYAQIGSNSLDTGGNFLRIIATQDKLGTLLNPNIQLNRYVLDFDSYSNRKIENAGTLRFKFATGSYDYDTKLSLSSAGLMTLDGNIRLENSGYISATPANYNQIYLGTNGNVGIGTNTPSSRLHVTNDGGFPEVLTLERSGVAQTRKFGIDNNTSRFMLIQNLIGEKFTILSGGNVGIGKLNPTQKLHVDGAVKIGVSLDYTSVTGLYAYDTTSWGTGGLIQCPCDNFETSDECSNPQLLLYSTYGSGCYDRIDTMYANADYKLYRFMGYVCTDPGTIIYTNRYFYGCKEWDINPSYKYRAQLN